MEGANSEWHPFEDGATLHEAGSEGGEILRDEDHSLGARITLERGGRIAPFAITCGVYGCMMHTRFLDQQAEAEEEYDSMRSALHALLMLASNAEESSSQILLRGLDEFVRNYP